MAPHLRVYRHPVRPRRLDQVGYQLGCDAVGVTIRQFGDEGRDASLHTLPGVAGDGGTRGQGFQASPVAAAAEGAIGENSHVADFRCPTRGACVEPSAKDEATAYACAYRDVDHVVRALTCPEAVLRKGRGVGVVLQQGR